MECLVIESNAYPPISFYALQSLSPTYENPAGPLSETRRVCELLCAAPVAAPEARENVRFECWRLIQITFFRVNAGIPRIEISGIL